MSNNDEHKSKLSDANLIDVRRGVVMQHGVITRIAPSDIPIIQLTLEGKTEEVRELIEQGEEVNQVDKFGRSALLMSCLVNDEPLTQLLLESGGNHEFVIETFKQHVGLGIFLADNRCFAMVRVQQLDEAKKEYMRIANLLECDSQREPTRKLKM
ncbi:MAG TPA: ankyrin repeat domain-containing protein [Anaerovoracaceae bacterium]|nr:ankyrin repeat domain-containing protein [Anaerovoracaceae bacterium]